MENIRKVAQQMTGDGIASWVIFACVIPVVCLLSIVNPLAHDQSEPGYRLFAAALSAATGIGLVILLWWLVLRRLSGWTRIIATFLVYGSAGAFKGLFQQWLLATAGVGDWNTQVLISRISINSTEWIVALGLLVFTVGSNRENFKQIKILRAHQAAVDEYLEDARSNVIADQDQIVQTVKSTISHDVDKLRESNPHELIADTQLFVADTVRPLSYKLSQEIPNWSMPTLDPSSIKLSWPSYFRKTSIAGRLSPLWTTVALCVFSLGYVASNRGFVGTILTFAVVFPMLFFLLFVSLRIAEFFRPKNPRGQFFFNIGTVIFLGFMPFVAGVYLASRGVFPNVITAVTYLILGLAVLVMMSIAMACYEDQSRIEHLTNRLQDQLHWIEKRISVEMWAHHGRVARALHGPYQAVIYSYIHGFERKLESGALTRADTETLANQLVIELEKVLAADDDQQSLQLALDRIVAMWSDVAEIHYEYDPAARELVENNPALSDVTLSLMHDGIVNAIRHGEATKIDIRILAAQEFAVEVTIDDNGPGNPETRNAGLGSKQFEANSLEWELITKEQGHTLRLLLPGGTTIDDALTRQREGVRKLA
ncbi:MAG: hypothetical protein WAS05_03925 [Candidatus Nanopelagicales bacterium]